VPVRRRIAQLATGLAGLVAGAGWFMLLVAVWPAAARPWIGGSTDNSLWQLAVGYNGLSRLLGRHSGAGRPGGPAPSGGDPGAAHQLAGHAAAGHGAPGHGFAGHGFGGRGTPGPLRLFGPEYAGQITWLLPVALLALVALLWVTRRAARTDRLRAATLLWGTWLLAAMAVLSFMRDMVNTYYPLVMSAPLAALVALGAGQWWRRRSGGAASALAVAAVLLTAGWSWWVLGLTPTFLPWLRWAVVAAAVVAAVALGLPALRPGGGAPAGRRLLAAGVAGAVLAGLAGPVAYTVDTIATPHSGVQVAAGPATSRGHGFPGRQGGAHAAAGPGGAFGRGQRNRQPDPALVALLRTAGTTWSAAVPSTMQAASLELPSGTSVMGIGGFTGSDPTPTLAQFQADVARGRIHYLIGGPAPGAGRPGGPGGPRGGFHGGFGGGFGGGFRGGRAAASAPIIAWASTRFTPITVGGTTVYDLTRPLPAR
jgi:hypothetical protein